MTFLKIPPILKIVLVLVFAVGLFFFLKFLPRVFSPQSSGSFSISPSSELGQQMHSQGWLLQPDEKFEFIWVLIFKQSSQIEFWSPRGLIGHLDIHSLNSTPGRKVYNNDGRLPEGFYKIREITSNNDSAQSVILNYPTPVDENELIIKLGEPLYQLRIGSKPDLEVFLNAEKFKHLVDILARAPESERNIAIFPKSPPLQAQVGDPISTINIYKQLEVLYGKLKKLDTKIQLGL